MLTSLRYVTREQTPYPSVTLRHIFAYTPLRSKRYVTFERPPKRLELKVSPLTTETYMIPQNLKLI